jgi:four helix bundle protein
MAGLPHANSFRDLLVYKKSRELSREIFRLSASFPKDEVFSLTSQIRRSSRSVGAQIAEAWGKRRYEKHFVSKLSDADSEQLETQHWIETAVDCGYWNNDIALPLRQRCEEIGRLLNGMMEKSDLFCGDPSTRVLRESPAEYFVDDPPPTDD